MKGLGTQDRYSGPGALDRATAAMRARQDLTRLSEELH